MQETYQEKIEKFTNNTYFSSIVEDFSKDKSTEKYIDICKVLEYREFLIGLQIEFFDKKTIKKLNKSKELNDIDKDCIGRTGILKVNNSNFKDGKDIICIFTDLTKIEQDNLPINFIEPINFKQLYDEYLSQDNYGGIIINLFKDNVYIDDSLFEYILNKDHIGLEKAIKELNVSQLLN